MGNGKVKTEKWRINILFKDIYDFFLRNYHINGLTMYGVIFVEFRIFFHGVNGAICFHYSRSSQLCAFLLLNSSGQIILKHVIY